MQSSSRSPSPSSSSSRNAGTSFDLTRVKQEQDDDQIAEFVNIHLAEGGVHHMELGKGWQLTVHGWLKNSLISHPSPKPTDAEIDLKKKLDPIFRCTYALHEYSEVCDNEISTILSVFREEDENPDYNYNKTDDNMIQTCIDRCKSELESVRNALGLQQEDPRSVLLAIMSYF